MNSFEQKRLFLCENLKKRGITNARILKAIASVPRHEFVDEEEVDFSYIDVALPINCQQTISQPFIVALMTSKLLAGNHPRVQKKVLEIGTGSGYQTAVLANLVESVYSIERIKFLYQQARERLQRIGITNTHLHFGDGFQGWPEHAPYPGIIVTAAAPEIPALLIEQLEIGGRMIIPCDADDGQQLLCVTKKHRGFATKFIEWVRFVPMREGVLG